MPAETASAARLPARIVVYVSAVIAVGLALVAFSLWQLTWADWQYMGQPLAMIAIVVGIGELRPIVMNRMAGTPVSISLAFVFATMYLWGLYPALILQACSVLIGELLVRKKTWKMLFNLGQFTISVGVAWLVMLLAGASPHPQAPNLSLSASHIWWVLLTWLAYHFSNLALVAGVAEVGGQTWWESFTDEFWLYTLSTIAVLALSPLVAVIALAWQYSWTLLPLILLPLEAVQRTAEMSRKVEHLALHDPLTGLPNRVLLADRLDHALARQARGGGRCALFFLDLDFFKVVNDGLGHAAGDQLLVSVARQLSMVLRSGDTLARFGGDEFALICEEVTDDEISAIGERISSCLREPLLFGHREVIVTASIGVTLNNPGDTAETMLRDADAAMYRAKAEGRDRVAKFEKDMLDANVIRFDTALELRQAVDRDQLRVYYQPVVEVATEHAIGFEALMRWEHPRRGLVPPDHFIGLAEETGLIVQLGNWILEQSLDQLARWRMEGLVSPRFWVAVNLSARQLQDRRLPALVAGALRRHALPAEVLHLEITETLVMNSLDSTLSTLMELRKLGVHLDVDDFGTGYSSLAYLRTLPVSTLKIDRSFTSGINSPNTSDGSIVTAIVELATALGLDVVAEGVETTQQLQSLKALGVRAAQGYLWSVPLPAEQMAGHWFTGIPEPGRTG